MLVQLFIVILGVLAVWLSQDARPSFRRYAPIFGLCVQPLWFYTSWVEGQWGIFAMSFIYLWAWGRGFYHNWVVNTW